MDGAASAACALVESANLCGGLCEQLALRSVAVLGDCRCRSSHAGAAALSMSMLMFVFMFMFMQVARLWLVMR